MSDTDAAWKAVYYDQAVRMLREMIASERGWLLKPAQAVVDAAGSDVLYAYAFNSAADAYQRSIRLGVLSDVLSSMTRNAPPTAPPQP